MPNWIGINWARLPLNLQTVSFEIDVVLALV